MDGVERLGPRGRELWAALEAGGVSGPRAVIALEACRTADRLEGLNEILMAGLTARGVLAEARQQQVALCQLLDGAGVDKAAISIPAPKGSRVDDLAARRSARTAGT